MRPAPRHPFTASRHDRRRRLATYEQMLPIPSLRLRLLLALAGVAALLGALAATASADEYGGLGGLAVFKAGRNGGHLEVNPRSHGVWRRSDGSLYIAETSKSSGKRSSGSRSWARKANTSLKLRVKLTSRALQLDGVAIDAEKQRLYALVVSERNAEEAQPCSTLKRLWRRSSTRSRPRRWNRPPGHRPRKEAGLLDGREGSRLALRRSWRAAARSARDRGGPRRPMMC